MPPKKKGKKGKKGAKKEKQVDPNALTEVDRTFYELTITDLNRKLARLRTLTEELQDNNDDLKNQLDKLDEDRSDIIMFLKRTLQEKLDEIAELQDRLTALQEQRKQEIKEFEEKIAELELEYKQMHEQLTSEVKLLEGKLNSLDEFRIMRDELMKKFEIQEQQMEEQEQRHKKEMYEIERKFIIAKDKLKKDMEARLLQLSIDFQATTELRIASTTQRVIRENIAINNELEVMLKTHENLYNENLQIKQRDKTLRQEATLHEAEKKSALIKYNEQCNTVKQLTKENKTLAENILNCKIKEKEILAKLKEFEMIKKLYEKLGIKFRILEQNLHASKCEKAQLQAEILKLTNEKDRLATTMFEAVTIIKDNLRLQQQAKKSIVDESLRVTKRESLLNQLLNLMTEGEKLKQPSLESVKSISAIYAKGDLGFVPKPTEVLRPSFVMKKDVFLQTGPSFEEFLRRTPTESIKSSVSTEVELPGEDEDIIKVEESDVFFKDYISAGGEEFSSEDLTKRYASETSIKVDEIMEKIEETIKEVEKVDTTKESEEPKKIEETEKSEAIRDAAGGAAAIDESDVDDEQEEAEVEDEMGAEDPLN